MPTIQEQIAAALSELEAFQKTAKPEHGGVVPSDALSPSKRAVLVRAGFLSPIMKGWYLAERPDKQIGESDIWYANFWPFVSEYLEANFKDEYCLSAEHSLRLLTADSTIPASVVVMVKKSTSYSIKLKRDTSIAIYSDTKTFPSDNDRTKVKDVWVMSMPEAIARIGETFVKKNGTTISTALRTVDKTALTRKLLNGGHSTIAGWVAGGWRTFEFANDADQLTRLMNLGGFKVTERNPFSEEFRALTPWVPTRTPAALRIEGLWAAMRGTVSKIFGAPPAEPNNKKKYLEETKDVFTHDAYNSLSIEGFKVTPDLIEKVRSGTWNAEKNPEDMQARNVLAARGYRHAFEAVMDSIGTILDGADPADTLRRDHQVWFQEMHRPMVEMNLYTLADLAGYRNDRVIITNARHVPPGKGHVPDCMDMLFALIKTEKDPAARAVLGHVFYEYIHPYIDGNGRTGRFLMNALFAAGGYPWVIVPVNQRDRYLSAMAAATEQNDVRPLSELLLEQANLAPKYREQKPAESLERRYSIEP